MFDLIINIILKNCYYLFTYLFIGLFTKLTIYYLHIDKLSDQI